MIPFSRYYFKHIFSTCFIGCVCGGGDVMGRTGMSSDQLNYLWQLLTNLIFFQIDQQIHLVKNIL